MPSLIDPTVPVYGNPTTASVRGNFATAAAEITALQLAVGEVAGPVATIADLRAQVAVANGSLWLVMGYWSVGDAPMVMYQYDAGSILPDNGGTVIAPTGGSGRFLAGPALNDNITSWPLADIRNWGAVGSGQIATVSTTSGSPNAVLSNAQDFANGQPVFISGAGAACACGTPTSVTVTTHGTTGSTIYYYRVAAYDAHGAISAASAEVSTTSGNGHAVLGRTRETSLEDPVDVARFQQIAWITPTGSPAGYIIYGRTTGAEQIIGTIQGGNLQWKDYGSMWSQTVGTNWIPRSPLEASANGFLTTTIKSGEGTTSLVLNNNAGGTTSVGTIVHDCGPAFIAAAGSTKKYLPAGTYPVLGAVVLAATGEGVEGEGIGISIIQGWGANSTTTGIVQLTGRDNALRHLSIDATQTPGNWALQLLGSDHSWVDHLDIIHPYSGILYAGQAKAGFLSYITFSNHVRGAYSLRVLGVDADGAPTGVLYVDTMRDNEATDAVGVSIEGWVATVNINLVGIQTREGIPFQIIHNSASTINDPILIRMQRCGANFSAARSLSIPDTCRGASLTVTDCYLQSVGSNVPTGNPGVYIGAGWSAARFTMCDIFGPNTGGMSIGGAGIEVNACHISQCGTAAINILATAFGVSVTGGGSIDFIGTAVDKATCDIGVSVAPGANDVSITGNWLGKSADIVDNSANGARVSSLPNITARDPKPTYISAAGSIALTAASYPRIYKGIANRLALLETALPGSGATYTLDTAANIIAAIPGVATVGVTINLRILNHDTYTITLAGGSGVTIDASATPISANTVRGLSQSFDLVGIVTGVGAGAAISFFGLAT